MDDDYQAEIGQKIREAIEHHRAVAADHRYRAERILEAWERRDFEFLVEVGVLTEGEANDFQLDEMLDVLGQAAVRAGKGE